MSRPCKTTTRLATLCLASSIVIAAMHSIPKIAEAGDHRQDCAQRLDHFVKELDRLLSLNPRSVDPLQALMDEAFPLKGCDIEDALSKSRQSQYFTGFSEQPTSYVLAFTSAGHFRSAGFNVSFGLLKKSGDSQLPFVAIHK